MPVVISVTPTSLHHQKPMHFRLFFMFLIMTGAAVVAYVFTLDTLGGVYALTLLLMLVVSSIKRSWFLELSAKGFMKLYLLSALGGVAAGWCWLVLSIATGERSLAEVLLDQSLYDLYVVLTLVSAALGVQLGFFTWALAKIDWKQPTASHMRVISGLIGSVLTTTAVCKLFEFSFAKPVVTLAWYDDHVIVVIAVSLAIGALVGFKLCVAGQYLMARGD